MNAIDVLSMAKAEGVLLVLAGERLTWKADHQPPADLLTGIKAHRLEIIATLVAANDPPPPPAHPAASAMASSKSAQPDEPQHFVLSAATAAPEWIAARDPYHNHLMSCCVCYAPSKRYCPAGAELRTVYDSTPMESTQ
ncbi:MAG: hypothetical protein ACOH2I_01155 [Pseudomonas sp.]